MAKARIYLTFHTDLWIEILRTEHLPSKNAAFGLTEYGILALYL
jgi:hypothetical protein